jgi:proton translocating ATP synthase F1 alpha subunit
MQYLAPYAGASVAEWFRDQGRHALVVYDDLTKHADAYRELALLLDRPPGREAYPGDIFHIHAELLERAAPRRAEAGGGSVTALALAETTEGDISGYIPTNLISITDGQIYLDTGRFERNLRPAVDVGRSVSRIGAAAQPPAMRAAAKNLRILIARFEAMEALTRVGLDLELGTRGVIERGWRLRELLRQERLSPRGPAEQVATLTAVNQGWLDAMPVEEVRPAVRRWLEHARREQPALLTALDAGRLPEGKWHRALSRLLPSEQPPEREEHEP